MTMHGSGVRSTYLGASIPTTKSLDLISSSQNHHEQPDFVFTFIFTVIFTFSHSNPSATRDPMPC